MNLFKTDTFYWISGRGHVVTVELCRDCGLFQGDEYTFYPYGWGYVSSGVRGRFLVHFRNDMYKDRPVYAMLTGDCNERKCNKPCTDMVDRVKMAHMDKQSTLNER